MQDCLQDFLGIREEQETSKERMLSKLKSASENISFPEIHSLSLDFFSVSTEEIDPETLFLKEDYEIDGVSVKSLSDSSYDIAKILDVQKYLKNFDSLKFSLYPQTLEATKTLKFGLVDVSIKFLISKNSFSYFPILDGGIKSDEEARESLKGVSYLKTLTPVNSSLEEAKTVALQQYSTADVVNLVKNSSTKEEFFSGLFSLGIALQKEEEVLNELIEKPFEELSDPCEARNLILPFYPEDLKLLEDDCCGEKLRIVDGVKSQDFVDPSLIVLVQELSPEEAINLYGPSGRKGATVITTSKRNDDSAKLSFDTTPGGADQILKDVEDFLKNIQLVSQDLIDCGEEKRKAIEKYYLYLEASVLNQINLVYVEERSKYLDLLNSSFYSLQLARNRNLQRIDYLKTAENALYLEFFRKNGFTTSDKGVLKIDDTIFSSSDLKMIENDTTFRAAVSSIREEIKEKEEEITDLSYQIESRKADLLIPSFQEKEVQDLLFKGLTSSFLLKHTVSYREIFSTDKNPLSNQAGYENEMLKLYTYSSVFDEISTMFSMVSLETGELKSYIGKDKKRGGKVATDVWDKYYSPNMIDNLFSYEEQGYKNPKPVFSTNGTLVSPVKNVTVVDPLGATVSQSVPVDILENEIDTEKSTAFWKNIDANVKNKILVLISAFRSSEEYRNFIQKIRTAAQNEARLAFSANLVLQERSVNTRVYDSYFNAYKYSYSGISSSLTQKIDTNGVYQYFKNLYNLSLESLNSFQDLIESKLQNIEDFIAQKNQCLSDQEDKISDLSFSFAGSSPNVVQPKNCEELLGSDPLGLKTTGGCPGITKNCYWKEFTKLMQAVSLMPIPDFQFLNKRLFRYYSIGFKIPVPSPPGVLPSLASGIPDPQISIPMPIVWKHVVSSFTPLGLFVVWVGVCGAVPGVYVLHIDERQIPTFLVTPKGPISIPAKSLGISEAEKKTFIESIAPLNSTFRVGIEDPEYSKMYGDSSVDATESSQFLDSIKSTVKNSVQNLSVADPSFQSPNSSEKRDRISKAFENSDTRSLLDAIEDIEKSIFSSVESLEFSSFKFPNDPRKQKTDSVGASEFAEDLKRMRDSGIDLGTVSKTKSLREIFKEKMNISSSDEEIVKISRGVDEEIQSYETSNSGGLDTTKVRERARIVKSALVSYVDRISSIFTEEDLGYVALASGTYGLPVPCYDDFTVTPLPPHIIAAMTAIKGVSNSFSSVSDEDFIDQISTKIDLSYPLPSFRDMIPSVNSVVLSFVPDIPIPEDLSIYNQVSLSDNQNFFKFKIRLPKGGEFNSVVISGSQIKDILMKSLSDSFKGIKSLIRELDTAFKEGDESASRILFSTVVSFFGTSLSDVTSDDLKSFLNNLLDYVFESLESLKEQLIDSPVKKFQSIRKRLFPEGEDDETEDKAFLEISTQEMLLAAKPLLESLQNSPLPFPLVLLGCSNPGTRLALTKVHPFFSRELLPPWEKMSLKNVPFVIWLDMLVSTAQKQSGFGSDFIAPYYFKDV